MGEAGQVSVLSLKGVGPQLRAKLERLGILTVVDLLFHLPLRYQDRTRLVPIGQLRPGVEALDNGKIEIRGDRLGRSRSVVNVHGDDTGGMKVSQYHFNASQRRGLKRGAYIQ